VDYGNGQSATKNQIIIDLNALNIVIPYVQEFVFMNHRTYTRAAFVFCALFFGTKSMSMNFLLDHPTRKKTKNRKTIRSIKAPQRLDEKDRGHTCTLTFLVNADNTKKGKRYWHPFINIPVITQPKMADHLKRVVLDEITRSNIQTPVSFLVMNMQFHGNEILDQGDKFLCDLVRSRDAQRSVIHVHGGRHEESDNN
jgi:hypothetical protein